MALFAPKAGCPLCTLVAAPNAAPSAHADVLAQDDNFTVYRERTHPVSSSGHIVIIFK